MKPGSKETSWEAASSWYKEAVGEKGHYYHQAVILPKVLSELNLSVDSNLLDLACGQGVLSRAIPKDVRYTGIDISDSLIKEAKKQKISKHHQFFCHDATASNLPLENNEFTHASIILALQNIQHPEALIKNAFRLLKKEGHFIIVLNHPCFRIPRQSSWGVDQKNKIQYRRIDAYMSELSIPITTHPGKKSSSTTLSFHRPLSVYSKLLAKNGFVICNIEELCSDKKSQGGAAKMEDRARNEIPLFMLIKAMKIQN